MSPLWTKNEIEMLYRFYPIESAEGLEKRFNRNFEAIRGMAKYRKIRRESSFWWTEADEKLLAEIYPGGTQGELLTAFPGKSYHAIKNHAKRLNIRKILYGDPLLFPDYVKRGETPIEKFEKCIMPEPNSGCWLWLGGTIGRPPHNYGGLRVDGRHIKAHRFSWELHNGPIPNGLQVLHHCDNTICCNPKHLFLGTTQDNNADCCAKGRNARGERHYSAKLTECDVKEIKNDSRSDTEIANHFHVHPSTIWHIRTGRTWKFVSPT